MNWKSLRKALIGGRVPMKWKSARKPSADGRGADELEVRRAKPPGRRAGADELGIAAQKVGRRGCRWNWKSAVDQKSEAGARRL
jgi:hypothetical protein